ncbi:hypothetical protein C8R46DRAFT_1072695 [Mycena filopes]|nr:hypothetical protein C8R46DRAFT_1072695 [Mycena filopes]
MYSTVLVLSFLAATGAVHAAQFLFRGDAVQVPVELGILSYARCPDALFCEPIFDAVMQKVGAKMKLELVYVAHLNSSDADFGVTCMHGPGECAGNVQQLCAAKYSSAWWGFVQCQNSRGRSQVGAPDVALECAESVGIDWETSGVGKCAGFDGEGKGQEGTQLLRESALRGKALGIEKSCTVLINHRKVCVHDSEWKDCDGGHGVDDFVKQINTEYERLNPDH